jgi:hypothetical protein
MMLVSVPMNASAPQITLRQVAAGRDVHAIFDHIVVVDGCAGVDNDKTAYSTAGPLSRCLLQ